MLICEMARDYKGRGMDLVDAVEALYDELGYYRNRTISLAYPGAEGAEQMRAIMAGLRTEHPAQLAGLAVEGVVDYAQGATMPRIGGDAADEQTLPGANVFEINLEGSNKVIIRPSGTEPKIKARPTPRRSPLSTSWTPQPASSWAPRRHSASHILGNANARPVHSHRAARGGRSLYASKKAAPDGTAFL